MKTSSSLELEWAWSSNIIMWQYKHSELYYQLLDLTHKTRYLTLLITILSSNNGRVDGDINGTKKIPLLKFFKWNIYFSEYDSKKRIYSRVLIFQFRNTKLKSIKAKKLEYDSVNLMFQRDHEVFRLLQSNRHVWF